MSDKFTEGAQRLLDLPSHVRRDTIAMEMRTQANRINRLRLALAALRTMAEHGNPTKDNFKTMTTVAQNALDRDDEN